MRCDAKFGVCGKPNDLVQLGIVEKGFISIGVPMREVGTNNLSDVHRRPISPVSSGREIRQ